MWGTYTDITTVFTSGISSGAFQFPPTSSDSTLHVLYFEERPLGWLGSAHLPCIVTGGLSLGSRRGQPYRSPHWFSNFANCYFICCVCFFGSEESVTIGLVTLSHLNVDVISMEPKIFEVPITSSWNVLMLKASQYPIANSIAHLNCKVFFIWTHIWDVAFNSTLKYLNHSLWVSLFMSFHIWGKSHGILMLSSHVAQGLCCAVSLSSNISLLSGRDTQCLLWLLLLSTTQLTQTHQVAREPYKELVPLTGSPETVLHRRWLDRIWFTWKGCVY